MNDYFAEANPITRNVNRAHQLEVLRRYQGSRENHPPAQQYQVDVCANAGRDRRLGSVREHRSITESNKPVENSSLAIAGAEFHYRSIFTGTVAEGWSFEIPELQVS
jgi:hypothetical protein